MSGSWSRRDTLKAGGLLGACALGYGPRALSQMLHTPEVDLDRWYRGVCGLCGLADPLFVGTVGGQLSAVKGDPSSPVSYGRLCTRGMTLPAGLAADRRVTMPLLRDDPSTKGTVGGLRGVTWDEALVWLGARWRAAGGSRTAALVDSALPCESHWLAAKLLLGYLESAVDCDCRLHDMTGLFAAEQAQGLPATVGCLDDIAEADLLLVAGADPAESHTTLFGRLAQCHRRSGTPLVLIDARRTLTVGLADVWIRPTRPGTEGLILDALAHVLVRERMVDEDAAAALPGYAAHAARIAAVTPEAAAKASGAAAADIEAAAALLCECSRPWSCHGRSLVAGGSAAVRALYDLHLMGGWLGHGASVTALHEGANTLGALLMGTVANRLPGLRSIASATDREVIADLWGGRADTLGTLKPSLMSYLAGLESGQLSLLLTIGGNPLPLLPDNLRWRRALRNAFVVAAGPVAPTETTLWADLVLPMAYAPLEERGCTINLERRIQLSDPPSPPAGVPTSFELIRRLAEALLDDGAFSRGFGAYAETGPERAWSEARAATVGTSCDLSGADYAALSAGPGLLWPYPEGSDPGDRNAPTGRHVDAPRLAFSTDRPPIPEDESSGDLALVVTRDSHHCGGRELTGFVPELHHAAARCWVEISGPDASSRRIKDGMMVAVESSTGVLVARAWITDRVVKGLVAVPEHYGAIGDLEGGTDGREEAESLASIVLPAVLDPQSSQPLSMCRVIVREPTGAELERRSGH